MTFDTDGIKSLIIKSQKIAIFGHENIDGDAIGSVLGFGTLLENLGKNVSMYTANSISKAYHFVPGIEKIQTQFDYRDYDLCIFVDFTPYERIYSITQGHEAYFDAQEKLIIDHHIFDGEIQKSLIVKDVYNSSCCGLLYTICKQVWPEYIDKDIATYFYLGLTTDTGNFMRGKNSQQDFSIASELIGLGADRELVIKNIFFSADKNLLPMAKLILERTTVSGNVIYTWYTMDELDSYGLTDDEVEGVHNIARSISGSGIPVFLRLRDMGTYRSGSMRSGRKKDGSRISVEKIAKTFEKGGGHELAAGFGTARDQNLPLEDDIKRIVDYINTEITKQA